MPNRYAGLIIPVPSDVASASALTPLISADLPGQIGTLPPGGEAFEIRTAGTINWPAFTTDPEDNKAGADNHCQGIAALDYPRSFLISGSDKIGKKAVVFLADLGSCAGLPSVNSNLLPDNDPPPTDTLNGVYDVSLDGEYFHAGGICTLGKICAIPLEARKGSKVILLDLVDPANPRLLTRATIDRPDNHAGAVALTTLPKGGLLLAVWTDGEKSPEQHLDLYVSPAGDPGQPAWGVALMLDQPSWNKYQALALIWNQTRTELFLLGTWNDKQEAPLLAKGTNKIDVFRMTTSSAWDQVSGANWSNSVTFERLPSQTVEPQLRYGDFRASAGFHINDVGRLSVLATTHNVSNARQSTMSKTTASPPASIRCAEFRSIRGSTETISSLTNSFIEWYEEEGFGGRRFTLCGDNAASVADYKPYKVYGKDIAGSIRSVVFQLPVGQSYLLFPQAAFGGVAIELRGTGKIEKLAALADVEMPKGPRSSTRLPSDTVDPSKVTFVHPNA